MRSHLRSVRRTIKNPWGLPPLCIGFYRGKKLRKVIKLVDPRAEFMGRWNQSRVSEFDLVAKPIKRKRKRTA
jgi:hypothetical protein